MISPALHTKSRSSRAAADICPRLRTGRGFLIRLVVQAAIKMWQGFELSFAFIDRRQPLTR